ncbi:MAG TPA: zinc-binding dehydrogenase [Gaiellaceae bacterium]
MKAAVIHNGRLELEERPDPVAGEGELLIRARAAGINRADLLQVAGGYPAPAGAPADIPGLECAGEVVATGERVLALLGGGGHAELVVVPERHTLPVPENVEWPSAGGFMEAFATAHDALFTQAGLRPDERLLVNGAAGGVGVAAVQLGLAAGAEVTGTARSNADRVAALGADTEPGGEYDVILELVGGDNLSAGVLRLAPGGRMIVIGTGAGSKAEIDFGRLMQRRARIQSSTLRSRTVDEKAAVVEGLRRDVLPLLASGRLTVPVHETFPLAEAQRAYEAFAAGGKFGKLVLLP